ncbi:flagellar assembly peptidoglycan hydrolase FlgJ [Cellvibrio sp. OA-2007]|uniref:flagellar assembly peptidoglycan hydrolase FlgJ n=1 Tax=Cellvibrio sp. OA-2007 TaxID=529823 RepID=UPI000781B963|nr:flagellar assembly peptidoglycan hydrolase FlgJ [Cellvibrio sp. OA-2007]
MLPIDAGAKISAVQDSYLDPNSLNSIKAMGRDKDPQALKEVAKKFEAMFVQQMLKTMREANEAFGEGNYFDSQTTRFHRDMLDQQMVLNLTSGRGIGLADHFYKQMLQNYGAGMKPESGAAGSSMQDISGMLDHAVEYKKASNADVGVVNTDDLDNWINDFIRMSDNAQLQTVLSEAESDQQVQLPVHYGIPHLLANKIMTGSQRAGQKASISSTQENFVMLLKPHAEKAAAELNISPEVLIAQVALETGWGKHVIHNKQGENSFNLFNIKTGSQWQGDKVNVATLEYRDGIAVNEKADFRKYRDYADSFSDYVRLMKNSSRYEKVLQQGTDSAGYAEALQSAGYATDPEYAKKIKQLLNTDAIKSLRELSPLDEVKTTAQSILSLATAARRQLVE